MGVHMNADWDNISKNSKNKTIWVPIQRVDRIISHGKKFDLTIGDRVIERRKRIPGIVKYVGPTHFDKGVWFGVALDAPKGKNNGTVKKKFYFSSEQNHGVMLPYKRLEHEGKAKKNKNNSNKKRNQRSHSNGFDKNGGNERKDKNGLTRNHSGHQKTQSDGVVNKGQIAQQLQLDVIQRDREREQQQREQQQLQIQENMQQLEQIENMQQQNMQQQQIQQHINTEYIEEHETMHQQNKTPSSDSEFFELQSPIKQNQKKGKLTPKKFYFSSEQNHGVMLPYKRLEHEGKAKKNKNNSNKKRNQRSHSNGFDKNGGNERKDKNGLTRNHSGHQKT